VGARSALICALPEHYSFLESICLTSHWLKFQKQAALCHVGFPKSHGSQHTSTASRGNACLAHRASFSRVFLWLTKEPM